MDTDTMGGRIRYWREKRKMSVKDLARETGIAVSTIYGLEQGAQKDSTKLHAIAAALRLNIAYLLHNKEPAELSEAAHLEYVRERAKHWPFRFPRERFDRLSPKQKRDIEELVEDRITRFETKRVARRKKSGPQGRGRHAG